MPAGRFGVLGVFRLCRLRLAVAAVTPPWELREDNTFTGEITKFDGLFYSP